MAHSHFIPQARGGRQLPSTDRRVVRWARSLLALLVLSLGACQSSGQSPEDDPVEELVGSAPEREDGAPPPYGSSRVSEREESLQVRRGALWYQLEFEGDRALVHVRLNDPPKRTSFFLPGPWAGREDFDDNIRITGARDPNGSVSFGIDRDERRIDVESGRGRFVELSYSVDLSRDDTRGRRFHPQVRDGVVFAYGPTILILPSDQISRQVRQIPIEVRAPKDWDVLTTWEQIDEGPSRHDESEQVWGFRAEDAGALRDTFVAAGADLGVERPTPPDGESSLVVGYAPGIETDRERFTDSITALVSAYRERFGDLGGVTVYVRRVSDERGRRARGVGRRGGFVVELSSQPRLDNHALLLLAHEAFHLWNGHHLRPAPEVEEETRWFKEGVTHYVALKMLAASGDFTRGDVLDELARSARFYRQNRAASGQAAGAAERARLPYDEGVLLATGLDATLLRASGGRVGIEDWLEHLIERSEAMEKGYHPKDLRRGLIEVAGSADSEPVAFWDSHVAGPNRLDLSDLFRAAGLHWLEGAGRQHARLLPLERNDSIFSAMFPTERSGDDRE